MEIWMFKNKFLMIFICAFAGVTLIFGATLGIIAGVRNSRAVVNYGSVRIEAGALRYLSAYYKLSYIRALRASGVNVSDTDAFWSSEAEQGKTQGDLYEESFEGYIRSLAASANTFLTESSYTKADKASVEATVEEVLAYKAGGSIDEFNRLSEKYGFDYDDFCDAAEILYKADRAKYILYGESGENLASFPDECDKYLETYSRVKLIFIRDKEIFRTDEEGKILYGDDGNALLREMTEEEKAVRLGYIETLDAAIDSRKNGGDRQITPEMFNIYLEKSDGDASMHNKGYYFNEKSDATAEFATVFPEVVERALEMSVGEYEKVACSIGVCYIYKENVVSGAYEDEEDPFFSDFYSDASEYLYAEILDVIAPEVTVKDKFYEVDYSEIPKASDFVILQWK